ncbi:MAG: hypothetical protein FWD88_01520 [Treponema sp.]|nr:hypothetical protein [Treponema sp.]
MSPNRAIGKKTNYGDELLDARILRDLGNTVYLTPEPRRDTGRKYDAIVGGLMFEFKNVGGGAGTLEMQFLRSRSQAPNVFINLENSPLSRRQIMSTLYGARNKPETPYSHGYDHYNKFRGGVIVLKIRGQDGLACIAVDELKSR